MREILNPEQVAQAIDRLSELIAQSADRALPIAVIGVRTRGETLARRLVERMQADGLQVNFGILDITFYRDDLSRRRGAPLVRATEIDFDIDDTWMLLVDDVLQTGRSNRAALDALHDFGRPRVIRLAVLVDRGGRELPIAADFVGQRAMVEPGQRIQVKLRENDDTEGVFLLEPDEQ